MTKKWLKIGLSVLIGGLFVWLAFRNVNLDELLQYVEHISYWWIPPFIAVTLFSHFCRAQRWRLLIAEEDIEISRLTLFSGVMVGYLLNIVFPRLGEVSRPMYVARKEDLSSSVLIGTIILERVIDLISMALLMAIVIVYIISDVDVVRQIFGEGTVTFFNDLFRWDHLLDLLGGGLILLLILYLLTKGAIALGERFEPVGKLVDKVQQFNRMLLDGLLAVRKVRNWGAFIGYTVLIWFNYVLMTYIPFWMFNMQHTFGLNLLDALTVTIISAVGIVLPSPGGIGTYHYFVKQALLILFAVPAVTGLAYATVTHAVMLLIIIISTPMVLAIDKFRSIK